jgi:hypothetical protein
MRRLAPVSLALLAVIPGHAAASPAPSRFGVTPAVVEVAARPPATLPAIRVFNTTEYAYAVQTSIVRLRHAPDGGLVPAPGRARGRVGPRTFRMAAHSSLDLTARWTGLPRGARSGALGVVVRGKPIGARARGLRTVYRLIATELVRLPGAMRRGGSLRQIDAVAGFGRRLLLTPAVHNSGKRYEFPRGALVVRNAAGRVVTRARFGGAVVLAGATRPFPVVLDRALGAGVYTVRATVRVGRQRSSFRRTLRLVGSGVLPVARLALSRLRAHGAPGGKASVDAVVRNTGTIPASGTVRVLVGGDRLRAETPRIAPGGSATVHLHGGHVARIPLDVSGTVTSGGRTSQGPRTNLIPASKPGGGFRFPWPILFALAAGVGIGAVVRRRT